MALNLDEILKVALKGGASDIHVKSGLPPMFRVDGALGRGVTAKDVALAIIGKRIDE